jgi:hypothetical protein
LQKRILAPHFEPSILPNDAVWFDNDGLHLGKHALIAHASDNAFSEASYGIERLEVFLTIAFRKRLCSAELAAIHSAAALSRKGDQAAANFRLAHTGKTRVPEPFGLSDLLAEANALLVQRAGFSKYDINQPRVPAGSGRESGRFASNRTSPAATAAQRSSEESPLLHLIASANDPQGLKAVKAAATAAGLNRGQRRQLHDAITGQGITDFQEILRIAKEIAGGGI